ncbi:MAG: putative Zn-dependent peptidase [Saprospiraceae bacterium]|jgi:zinc protease
MKNIFLLLMVAILVSQCTPETVEKTSTGDVGGLKIGGSPDLELDRSSAPQPGPAPKIQMGTYETFTLDNGLECIVVKNEKLPRVSFQYTLNIDPLMEKDDAGMQEMMGEMLSRGTENRTKKEIDEQVDFIGATLSTYSSGVYASSLSKHSDKIIELMADVLLNPTFPEAELEKVKTQTLSGLASAKNEPNAISSNVANVLRYGKTHPYGEITTEETVGNITSESIKAFYYDNFNPNAGYLIIVGDIDAVAAKAKMQKYFKAWEPGEISKRTYNMPEAPQGRSVAVVDRPGAVQSVITVTYPINLKPGSDDLIAASVANSVLGGGGFSGRLMQNLREDKGYTYGSRSSLSYDPLVGVFTASASVRNEVTDSAITEFIYEIDRMGNEKVNPKDLQKTKNIMAGSFARSLERPQTVANFALNIARYDLPGDYYEKYLERLSAVTAEDVMRVSKKYFNSNNAHILVVGDKDEVAEKLTKFDAKKEVKFYDNYGNPAKAAEAAPEGVTAETVVDNYIKAIGGKAAMEEVKDIQTTMELSAMGQTLDAKISQKSPNKYKMTIKMQGQVFQQQVYDGTNGAMSGMMGNKKLEGEELMALKEQSAIFTELNYAKDGYTLEMKGMESVDGKDAYKVLVTAPSGSKATDYYSKETGLKIRSISSLESPQGAMTQTVDYSDYKATKGIKMPQMIKQSTGPQTIIMTVKEVKINEGINDDEFKVD